MSYKFNPLIAMGFDIDNDTGGGTGGQVDSVVGGTDIAVDNTDPINPIVSFDGVLPTALSELSDDSTHRLVTDTEKSTWNAKQDALTAGTDYLTPLAIATAYEPKKGSDDNYVTDAEKIVIGNTSNTNTGDQDLSGLQPLDDQLTSIAGLVPGVEGKMITSDGLGGYQISTPNDVRSYLNVEDGAEANTVDSVNSKTGAVSLDADDISDSVTTNKFTNATDISRLANTSGSNTGDQDISGIATNAGDISDLETNKADKTNVLELDNTTPFTPDAEYEPATKKYVDDNAGGGAVDSVNGETGTVVLKAENIDVETLGTPTYTTIQDYLNQHNSSGFSMGGEITDAGSGQINVAAGTGFIRATNSGTAELLSFDWSASNGISLTDDMTNYVYVDYNSGTPVVGVETTKTANGRSKFYLGKVFREDTDLHILEAGQNTTEPLKRTQQRLNSVFGEIQRASGMLLSAVGTRQIAISAGVYFAGLTRVVSSAFDSTATDFEYYYLLNGVWTEVDADTISNTQYNDVSTPGSESLATLSNNNYGVHWVYMDVNGTCLVVYGQGDYAKLSDAEAAEPPQVSYGHIADMSILVGRVIIEKSATSFDLVQSAFGQTYSSSVVTDHGDLAGLSNDDHTQYLLASSATDRTTFENNWTDLTDSGASTLHYHASDRDRANHTGTQAASTISDFDTEVSNNSDVAANTSARHDAVTVTDSTEIDFTLTGQDITASLKSGSIDETKLDTSVNDSLDLADSAIQSGDLAAVATSGSYSDLSDTPTIPTALADLSDDATHRVVTDTEKSTWNAKQDALIADTDYLTPGTASSTYEPIRGGDDNYVTDAQLTIIGNTSGTNSGDNAVNSLYSSLTQYTDEMAQDAVGGMVDSSLTYTDGTPELKVTNPVSPETVGFTITAGTTPKTLTVALDASVSGTNTGDQDLSAYVETAGDTMTGPLIIAGSTDAVQSIVRGNSSQTTNIAEWQDSSSTVLMSLDELGRLGIGTDTPTYKLHVKETGSNNPELTIESGDSGSRATFTLIGHDTSNDGDFMVLTFRTDQTDFVYSCYDASTTTFHETFSFNYLTDIFDLVGNTIVSSYGGYGTVSSEKAIWIFHNDDSGATGESEIGYVASFRSTKAYGDGKQVRFSAIRESDWAGEIGMGLFTSENSSTTTEKVRISASGDVGIGTITPSEKLDVNGNIVADDITSEGDLFVDGNIKQTGTADHITITAGTNKLVKISVLRQEDTSNTYDNKSVVLTGWGVISASASGFVSETVTFGITFDSIPITIVNACGWGSTSSSFGGRTWSNASEAARVHGKADSLSTTSFRAMVSYGDGSNLSSSGYYYYTWIAIGVLA